MCTEGDYVRFVVIGALLGHAIVIAATKESDARYAYCSVAVAVAGALLLWA